MHSDVVAELMEGFGASHEIGLAIHFDDHADLSTRVNIVTHETFRGLTLGLLGGGHNDLPWRLLMFPLDGLNAIVFRAKSTSTARNC